ncbi:ABC transporter permease [Effusibacillus lacus]|uniref:ABC transporter permease n=1 Tax=Effusibacillus lacus TaxID=1348429 RepID=A0A292YCC9_9BACL|nr:ABC transporter permease [Effusibacillus lacus]TCS75517.1 putative spermidine/putrescine transport system permease protein/spermidine/putrescine transport system permease protein [Effusibacillus lacus]GAX88982.1 ABC transporter permease [Effusibacillus lacus]
MQLDTEKKVGAPVRVPTVSKLFAISGLKWLLLLIPLLYVLVTLAFALFSILKLSVMDKNGFTFAWFARFFTEPVYVQVLFLTMKTAFIVTVVSLLIAYPIAYVLAKLESKLWKQIILGVILVSFWISLLVRTFAWTVLLQKNGVVNKLLLSLGIIDKPLDLLYNTTGVVVGMTHILVPYMILSLYAVMEGIDRNLLKAAEGMGARPWKAFVDIFLPLSLPGVLSGSLLVFVLGIGYFITPALLGGNENTMISQLIFQQTNIVLNWNFAAAIAVVLLITTLILLWISMLIAKKYSVLKEVE